LRIYVLGANTPFAVWQFGGLRLGAKADHGSFRQKKKLQLCAVQPVEAPKDRFPAGVVFSRCACV
jgi:hypothetical protein